MVYAYASVLHIFLLASVKILWTSNAPLQIQFHFQVPFPSSSLVLFLSMIWRRLNAVPTGPQSSQLQSQPSQQSFSQGMSSQHGMFSQLSQNSLNEVLTNDQVWVFSSSERFGSFLRYDFFVNSFSSNIRVSFLFLCFPEAVASVFQFKTELLSFLFGVAILIPFFPLGFFFG